MRSLVPQYELRAPATLAEALDTLAAEPGTWRPFAGGTDLMVLFEAGRLDHKRFISLWRLRELRFIAVSDTEVAIGAVSTYSDVRRHPVLASEFPMLSAAAAETGGVANQNRGTIGGNIANASPAADTPPALLAYGAVLEIASARGTRRIRYDEFHRGYKQMDLAPHEVIHSIHLPRRTGAPRQFYRKVGTRRAQAISKVCLAGAIEVEQGIVMDARIGIGSVAPTVIRARHVEKAISGQRLDERTIHLARDAVAADISPIDDIRSTVRYRTEVTRNLVEQFLREVS
jgi:CO/xanthine dehydrogenase FAD-binding subunit